MKKFLLSTIISVFLLIHAHVQAISPENSCFAFQTIAQKLFEWNCTPIRIQYGGDEMNNAENVAYMNDLAESQGFERKFSACMVFYSDFRSPKDNGQLLAWNFDSIYENYSWYFGFYEDDTWKLMTWGY